MYKRMFNGKQLKNARLFRGLTLTKLADLTGISKQSLSLYEKESIPEYVRVQTLASALKFPYDFFFQKDTYQTVTDVTYFRSLASATKMNRISQSTKLEYVAKIYEILLEYIDFPSINLPDVDFDCNDDEFDDKSIADVKRNMESISKQVRSFWGIGDAPINDLQFLLEKNGIIITGFDTLEEQIDAFSQSTIINNNEMYFIAVVLGKRPKGRIMFDMAHELGHILLHPWSESLDLITKDEFKEREKQANMFASALLLPENSFGRDVQVYPIDLEYYKFLKKKWNVSIQAMVYRTNQLGIITDNQFQYIMRQISKNGWRTKEPGDVPYFLNENIFQGAIDLLIEEKVMNPTSIMQTLKQNGISLYHQDVEKLLNLRCNTLFCEEEKTQIMQIKLNGHEHRDNE